MASVYVKRVLACVLLAMAQVAGAQTTATAPPKFWIDGATQRRIIRVTDEPGSRNLYFNYTAFTPDGKQMVYSANHSIRVLDIGTWKSRLLVSGPIREIVVSKSKPIVYFMRQSDQGIYVADISTGELRKLGVLPARAVIDTVNADDTLAAGTYIDGDYPDFDKTPLPPDIRPSPAARMAQRVDAKIPMVMFTMDLRTGTIHDVLHSTDWLNHLQFSPKDPSLLLYCHEGLWQDVDRIWLIHADGSGNTLVHTRSARLEIAGHEFWDPDGKTIWYDLQSPRGKNFAIASYDASTGRRNTLNLTANEWSVHYNISSDGTIFCGDGGDPFMVAEAPDGKWIWLFRPKSGDVKQSGDVDAEHLVNLNNHDYKVEPNVMFSPDMKYVIFTSNMFGPNYVFAVEVAKSDPQNTATAGQ